MKYFAFFSFVIYLASCTIIKVVEPSTESEVNSILFGAVPNDNKDDTQALQKALDTGYLELAEGNYIVTSPLVIKKYGSRITSKNVSAVLDFKGVGPCIAMQRQHGNYLVNCIIENIAIVLHNKNSIGIEFKASHSVVRNLRITLKGNNNVGLLLVGDNKGTGPYYNTFYNCNVQGRVHLGFTGQVGVEFTSDVSTSSRCPNANTFFGGRVGQVENGFIINGGGNTLYSPTLEGVTKSCFYFDNKTSSVGCISNNVYSPYIEGAAGVLVADYGRNSINCQVLNPFVTSIGIDGAYIKDRSIRQNNGFIISEDISNQFSRQIVKGIKK